MAMTEHNIICSCGKEGCDHLTVGQRRDFLAGVYWVCRHLTTSPRMNKPQRELIEEQATTAKDELEALGVTFGDGDD